MSRFVSDNKIVGLQLCHVLFTDSCKNYFCIFYLTIILYKYSENQKILIWWLTANDFTLNETVTLPRVILSTKRYDSDHQIRLISDLAQLFSQLSNWNNLPDLQNKIRIILILTTCPPSLANWQQLRSWIISSLRW